MKGDLWTPICSKWNEFLMTWCHPVEHVVIPGLRQLVQTDDSQGDYKSDSLGIRRTVPPEHCPLLPASRKAPPAWKVSSISSDHSTCAFILTSHTDPDRQTNLGKGKVWTDRPTLTLGSSFAGKYFTKHRSDRADTDTGQGWQIRTAHGPCFLLVMLRTDTLKLINTFYILL